MGAFFGNEASKKYHGDCGNWFLLLGSIPYPHKTERKGAKNQLKIVCRRWNNISFNNYL